jgi:hypothetical protein
LIGNKYSIIYYTSKYKKEDINEIELGNEIIGNPRSRKEEKELSEKRYNDFMETKNNRA